MANMHRVDIPFQATQPGLLDLIHDGDAMRLWELIRLQRAPVSVESLSAASSISPSKVQQQCDAMLHQGLLQAVRARKPRNWVGYRVTRERIVIGFDRGSPDIEQRLRELNLRIRTEAEELVRRFGHDGSAGPDAWRFSYVGFDRLERGEKEELRRRIRAVCDYWNLLGSRADRDASRRGQFRKRECNHVMQIHVQPLKEGLLAMPEIWIIPNSDLQREGQARRNGRHLDALSPRERDVARALALGQSRKRVAEQLGISVNTVGTLAKRIFTKLAVRKSSELAAQLSTAASQA